MFSLSLKVLLQKNIFTTCNAPFNEVINHIFVLMFYFVGLFGAFPNELRQAISTKENGPSTPDFSKVEKYTKKKLEHFTAALSMSI